MTNYSQHAQKNQSHDWHLAWGALRWMLENGKLPAETWPSITVGCTMDEYTLISITHDPELGVVGHFKRLDMVDDGNIRKYVQAPEQESK